MIKLLVERILIKGVVMKKTLLKLGIAVAVVAMLGYTSRAEEIDEPSPEEIAIMMHHAANQRAVEEEKKKEKPKELNVKVEKGVYTYYNRIYRQYMSIDTIDITVLADKIKIDNVTANHGRCELVSSRKNQYPKTYYYGDKIGNSFIMNRNGRGAKCNVLSVEIVSDGLTYSIEFK